MVSGVPERARKSGRAEASPALAAGHALQGFSYTQLKAGLSAGELAGLIRAGRLRRSDVEMVIPPRTLNRRLREGQTLRLEEADAVARLMRVRDHAVRVFDDPALAERWLASPSPELGDETPIEMARTDVGAREVEAALLRIEHGVVG